MSRRTLQILGWRIAVVVVVRLQQHVTVALHEQPVLLLHEETAAATQRPAAHFEYLDGRIGLEDKVLVRSYEHENEQERAGHNHAVRCDWHCRRTEHGAQINPPSDVRRQLGDALQGGECGIQ